MLTIATPSAAFLSADEFPDELLPHAFGGMPALPWLERKAFGGLVLWCEPPPEPARPPQDTAHPAVISAGRWVCAHYRSRAAESGTQSAARQLRKQGYPLEISLAVLTGRAQ